MKSPYKKKNGQYKSSIVTAPKYLNKLSKVNSIITRPNKLLRMGTDNGNLVGSPAGYDHERVQKYAPQFNPYIGDDSESDSENHS